MIIFYEWNKIWRVRKLFQPPLSFFFFQPFLLSFSCFFFLNTFFPALVLILETKFLIVFTIKPSMSLFKSLKFKTNRKSWICDSFNQQWYTKKNKKKKKGRKQRTSGLKRGAIDIQRPFYFHGSLGNTWRRGKPAQESCSKLVSFIFSD